MCVMVVNACVTVVVDVCDGGGGMCGGGECICVMVVVVDVCDGGECMCDGGGGCV